MSKQLRVYREGAKTEFDYQILWEEDFTKLADAVKKLELSCGKICIVADDTVGNLYGKEVQKALEELDVTVDLYTFPAGEASKNLDTVKELYAFLIEHHYTRKVYWQHLAEALPEILPDMLLPPICVVLTLSRFQRLFWLR